MGKLILTNGVCKWLTVAIIAALLLVILMVACNRKQQEPSGQTKPETTADAQVTIRVSGAWALYPIMVRWGEEFSKLHPNVRIDISAGGAGKGVADALARLVDIGMVSRAIKPEEIAQGAFFVPVAKDAVFPTINAANPVLDKGLLEKGIKKQTLVDLFIMGKKVTWGEVVGTSNSEIVQVYTRSDSCGAAETWALYLGGIAQEDLQGVAVYGDPGVAEAVRRDVLGLGYNNLNFIFDAQSGKPMAGILPLPIDINENGIVDPDESIQTKAAAIQAVASGRYPSPPARDLYLITKDAFRGMTREFVRWILTDGQKYLSEVGYIPISDEQLREALEKIEQ